MKTLTFTGLVCLAGLLIGCGGKPANTPDVSSSGGETPVEGTSRTPGEAAEPAPTGPKAPDFALPTLDGDNISLSDYAGEKVVLIDFWATTCDPCLAEMPELVKLYHEKKPKGFEILAISTDGPETRAKVSSTVKQLKMDFPILLDEETEIMDRYNPKGELPFTVLVDKNGVIVLKRASYQPGDTESWNSLVAAIDGALTR